MSIFADLYDIIAEHHPNAEIVLNKQQGRWWVILKSDCNRGIVSAWGDTPESALVACTKRLADKLEAESRPLAKEASIALNTYVATATKAEAARALARSAAEALDSLHK